MRCAGTARRTSRFASPTPPRGDQPRGKQSRKPEGIFYTSTSGIWQTVWLEPVPEVCIDRLRFTPDVDAKALRLRVAVNSFSENLRVEAVASAGGQGSRPGDGPRQRRIGFEPARVRIFGRRTTRFFTT